MRARPGGLAHAHFEGREGALGVHIPGRRDKQRPGGEEGIPLVMMRDDRYAVALADAFTRVTNGNKIGVCTVMGG